MRYTAIPALVLCIALMGCESKNRRSTASASRHDDSRIAHHHDTTTDVPPYATDSGDLNRHETDRQDVTRDEYVSNDANRDSRGRTTSEVDSPFRTPDARDDDTHRGHVVTVSETDAPRGSAAGFLREAASGGQMEVEAGRLAIAQAENERVREFGQRMIDDHSRANQDLLQIARLKNVSIPQTLSRPHKSMLDQFSNLSGEEFDRKYMDMMVHDHVDVIQLFEQQAKNATDADVKAFAERTLPTLREHLRLARDIADELGIDTPEH